MVQILAYFVLPHFSLTGMQPILIWLLLCRIKLEKVKQSILHMNCFHMKKCWTLKETHNPYKIGVENWDLGLWEKVIVLKWVVGSLKANVLRKSRITVISSSQWQVSVIGIFWVFWLRKHNVVSISDWSGGKKGGGGLYTLCYWGYIHCR